jgi:hypothetical protein
MKGEAHGIAYTGLGWWGLGYTIKYATASLAYPICKRHLFVARVLRAVYFGSFVVLLVSGIVALSAEDKVRSSYALALLIASLLLFIYAALYAPVRVRPDSNGDFIVNISNEIYADAFSQLNTEMHERVANARTQEEERVQKERVRTSFGYKMGRYFGGLFRRS